MGGQSHDPTALPPAKTRYPFYSRLGRAQCRSGRVRKILPPPGFDTLTVQPVVSGYTDWAIPAHYSILVVRFKVIAALILKITVIWDVKLYLVHSINVSYEPTAAIFNLHNFFPEDGRYRVACTLTIQAAGSCKTYVLIHKTNFQVYLLKTHCAGHNQLIKKRKIQLQKTIKIYSWFPFPFKKIPEQSDKTDNASFAVISNYLLISHSMLYNIWEIRDVDI